MKKPRPPGRGFSHEQEVPRPVSDASVPTVDDGDREQGQAIRIDAQLRSLGKKVEDLLDTDQWQQWLEVATRFHSYSFGNQLLIAFQRPDATRVAGYRKWQELERQVRKGEKGIGIFAPIVRKEKADDGSDVNRIAAFKVVHVFDIAQTDGKELPARPSWPMVQGDDVDLVDALVAVAEAEGLAVDFIHFDYEGPSPAARGWYHRGDKTIHIRQSIVGESPVPERVPAASQAKTLAHELGHHFDPDAYADRQEAEIVAEAVAYIVATNLGLECDDASVHYLASWQTDAAGLLKVGARIQKAVVAIEAGLKATVKTDKQQAVVA